MSCAAHRATGPRTRGRVVCFECYRARLDRPEHVPVPVVPFPRVLTGRQREHRRHMLAFLSAAYTRARETTA
jgi:hypothetical protein